MGTELASGGSAGPKTAGRHSDGDSKGDGSVPPSGGVTSERETATKICRDVLAPLVRADGGILYLVSAGADDVHIHLAGTCSGCPGAAITRDRMLEPAIKSVFPKAKLRLTTGVRVPPDAEKID